MSTWKKIEGALRQHPSVRDCVVLGWDEGEESNSGVAGSDKEGNNPKSKSGPADKNRKSDPRFVAYVVSNQAMLATANELRSHISATLPNNEVPGVFVFRNSLPRMPDGKVDRAALRITDQPERNLPQKHLAPRTVNEQLMAKIWEETLKLKDIGINDNFFDIVRDSFLAMEIIARVRKVFAVNLPVRALFADPTVAGMTAAVLQQKAQWTNGRSLAGLPGLDIPRRQSARLHLSKN